MKSFLTCLLAIAAISLIGACDSHPWSQTKGLHEKYQEHGHGEGEHAEASHDTGTAEAHPEVK
ncbi:MAG: hypothetical protein JWO94_2041 [Verrucomicrobiaceae bacterium]|nr:hypothetical protein [Verrucomicrobiaceae bacterium]